MDTSWGFAPSITAKTIIKASQMKVDCIFHDFNSLLSLNPACLFKKTSCGHLSTTIIMYYTYFYEKYNSLFRICKGLQGLGGWINKKTPCVGGYKANFWGMSRIKKAPPGKGNCRDGTNLKKPPCEDPLRSFIGPSTNQTKSLPCVRRDNTA